MPALRTEWLGLRLAALTAALLFAVHPLRVESMAWATERQAESRAGTHRPRRGALRAVPRGAAEARNNLGLILAKAGKQEEAEAEFREALTLKPDLRDAQNNLEHLISLRGKRPR